MAARTWKVPFASWDRVGQSILRRSEVAWSCWTEILVGVPNSGNASLTSATYQQQKRKDRSALEKPQLFDCVLCSSLRRHTHSGKEYADTQCTGVSEPVTQGTLVQWGISPINGLGMASPSGSLAKLMLPFFYSFCSGMKLSVLGQLLGEVCPVAKVFRKLVWKLVAHERLHVKVLQL